MRPNGLKPRQDPAPASVAPVPNIPGSLPPQNYTPPPRYEASSPSPVAPPPTPSIQTNPTTSVTSTSVVIPTPTPTTPEQSSSKLVTVSQTLDPTDPSSRFYPTITITSSITTCTVPEISETYNPATSLPPTYPLPPPPVETYALPPLPSAYASIPPPPVETYALPPLTPAYIPIPPPPQVENYALPPIPLTYAVDLPPSHGYVPASLPIPAPAPAPAPAPGQSLPTNPPTIPNNSHSALSPLQWLQSMVASRFKAAYPKIYCGLGAGNFKGADALGQGGKKRRWDVPCKGRP